MNRSFSLVDDKLEEAAFFYEQLATAHYNIFEARCYFSAFVSAARSVTFSLQAVMGDIPGFNDWYAKKQAVLKADPLAQFFVTARNDAIHIGITPLNGGYSRARDDGSFEMVYQFCSTNPFEPMEGAPQTDAVSACREYLVVLVSLIHECYRRFGPHFDPEQYFTMENMKAQRKTPGDLIEELGFPCDWLDVAPPMDDETFLRLLRRESAASVIDPLFERYLGKHRLAD